jgi:diguanylate cyclase (GGDEF)-like protein
MFMYRRELMGLIGRFPFRFWRWKRIYLLILILSITLFATLSTVNFFDRLYLYSRPCNHIRLDKIFDAFIVATPALIAVLMVYVRDLRGEIQKRRNAEQTVSILANYDPLTGLANRQLFQQEFGRRLRDAEARGVRLAVLVLDLDRFKSVNDLHGHGIGDKLLRAIAERLRASIRAPDFLSRIGGDEFAILCEGPIDDETHVRLVQRLLSEMDAPVVIDHTRITVTTSIGIAAFPQDGTAADVLLQRADLALYKAKAAGRNRHAFFDPLLDGASRERLVLESELRDALRAGEVVPYYQPLIHLASKRLVGFEVLARWRHPRRGVLIGAEFVPLAENTGLIDLLFDVMLTQSCRDATHWPRTLLIAVNVSPTQFNDRSMVKKVLDTLHHTGLPANRLEIEITENALVQDFDVAKDVVQQLNQSGVRVSLDDFGTGYSGFRHLHQLSLDKIKIDRSFVANLHSGGDTDTIITSMITLGHSLGLEVTCEGIERQEDATWLMQRGCDQGQGFLFSRPLPAEEIPAYLASLGEISLISSVVNLRKG